MTLAGIVLLAFSLTLWWSNFDGSRFTSYFFMKVGYGNCLLGHAVRTAQAAGTSFLWVGFGGEPVPSLEPDAPLAGISGDLVRIARASWDDSARQSARVLTFQNESLYVWRITERLRPISEAEVESLMAMYAGDPVVCQRFKFKPGDADRLRSELRSKALPVRLEAVIKRALLPARPG